MSIIDVNTGYIPAQAERGKLVVVNNNFLKSTLGYGLSGQGRYAILTYDLAASESSQPTLASPATTVVSSHSLALTGAATTLGTSITFDSTTKLVRISFAGAGDVRITYDGTTPVGGSIGEVWFKGGFLEINKTIAEDIQVIKDSTTNSSLYVTEFA